MPAAYRPLITESGLLAQLDGHRYVILRPDRSIREACFTVQHRLRALDLPLSYPAEAHVTMAGFPAGVAVGDVQELTAEWAKDVRALDVAVERIIGFPPPHAVVAFEVQRTPALVHALESIRRRATARGLPYSADATPISVEEWVFHMSIAYCARLDADQWRHVMQTIGGVHPQMRCVIEEAEIVAFDDRVERSRGLYSFGAPVRL